MRRVSSGRANGRKRARPVGVTASARGCWLACLLACALATTTQAAVEDGQSFENWTVGCEELEEQSRKQCFIFQNLITRDGGQRVLRVVVGYLPGDDTPIGLVTLPLGISLPPGASVQVDDEPAVRFPIERCEPNGCRAGFRLEPQLLSAFKKGQEVKITFHDQQRQPISVPLSLKGFTAGLRALRS